MGFKLVFWFAESRSDARQFVTQGSGPFHDLIARKLKRELWAEITIWANSDLPWETRAGSRHVYRVTWYDPSTETNREGYAWLVESFPGDECSICRQWHGLEIVHASE